MIIEEGKLYFIKDTFLVKYGEKYNLMDNKEKTGTKRPSYFCFRDNKEKQLLWFVPMSKQHEKYKKIYNKKKEKLKKEPNNFIFFNNIAGMKGVFLIQNMFPTREVYIQEEYHRRGEEVKIAVPIQKEILEKARTTIALANKGVVATYTNLPEFIKDMKKEIEDSLRKN